VIPQLFFDHFAVFRRIFQVAVVPDFDFIRHREGVQVISDVDCSRLLEGERGVSQSFAPKRTSLHLEYEVFVRSSEVARLWLCIDFFLGGRGSHLALSHLSRSRSDIGWGTNGCGTEAWWAEYVYAPFAFLREHEVFDSLTERANLG